MKSKVMTSFGTDLLCTNVRCIKKW